MRAVRYIAFDEAHKVICINAAKEAEDKRKMPLVEGNVYTCLEISGTGGLCLKEVYNKSKETYTSFKLSRFKPIKTGGYFNAQC